MPAVDPPLTPPTALSVAHNLGALVNGVETYTMTTNMWCQKTRVDADFDFTEKYGATQNEYHNVYTGIAERGGATNDDLTIQTNEPWLGPLTSIILQANAVGTGTLTTTPNVGAPSSVAFTDGGARLERVLISDPRNGDVGGTANLKYISRIGTIGSPNLHRDSPALDGDVVTGSVGDATIDFSDFDTATTVFGTLPDLTTFSASGYANFTLS